MTSTGAKIAMLAMLAPASLSAEAAHADQELFEQYCSRCHPRAQDVAQNVRGRTVEDRIAELQSFLKRHHAEDSPVREQIARFLAGLGAQ